MSKIGKRARAQRKQQKQIKKIQKRLTQAGVQLDLKESSISDKNTQYLQPKKQIVGLKKHKRELQNKLKDSKTSNKIKLTQKQLSKPIQQRKNKAFAPSKAKLTYIPQESEEHKANRQVKELREKLRKQIATPEVTEELTPNTSEQSIPVHINTDTSFYSHAVISNYRVQIKQYPNSAGPILSEWLDRLLKEYGEEEVAQMLQDGIKAGIILTPDIAYDGTLLTGYMASLLDFLEEMTDWGKAELMEEFEVWEDIQ